MCGWKISGRRIPLAKKQQTFEEKLLALEAIVQKMENGNLPLEDTLKCYEEGIRLTRELNASLTDAEKRMLELAGGELLPMEDAP